MRVIVLFQAKVNEVVRHYHSSVASYQVSDHNIMSKTNRVSAPPNFGNKIFVKGFENIVSPWACTINLFTSVINSGS